MSKSKAKIYLENDLEKTSNKINKRVKFDDLYDTYPGKWVLFVNSEYIGNKRDTCEVYGVYDTDDDGYLAARNIKGGSGLYYMVREEEEIGYSLSSVPIEEEFE
ncbi:MAG: hypothetical protein FWG64_14860 [Firmicutes bacterium]|nr:hypothetical protein [Bacillota bacterium]